MEMREMISHNLLRLRKERGMSQEEVAFLCKMSVRTYGKIEGAMRILRSIRWIRSSKAWASR